MGTARHARRALIAAAAALLCFVAVFAAAGNSVRAVVSGAFQKSEDIRTARALPARAVTLQLDEETGARGSIATGQRSFLEPYHLAGAQLPPNARGGIEGLPPRERFDGLGTAS